MNLSSEQRYEIRFTNSNFLAHVSILPISDLEHLLLVTFADFSLVTDGATSFVLLFLEPRPFVLARGVLNGGSSINCLASNSSFLLTYQKFLYFTNPHIIPIDMYWGNW